MTTSQLGTKKNAFIAIGAVAVVLAGHFTYRAIRYVSTDDAQVSAHVTMLSSRVSGTIQKVFVEENQKVKAGDTLAQIDTSDYSNSREAADAAVASLEARVREAETNFKRASDLMKEQAIPREQYDNAVASLKDLQGKLKAAKAQSEQASLNVSYTKIIAPTDGLIARKSVEPGQYVPAGQALFGFVESDERWVTANLKETDLSVVRVGQHVDVAVDAVSGRSFEGEVESVSPATGAVFSLLPPDNSTGNFTKVVQRVPVRIKLTGLKPEDIASLQAGLSAVVDIKVR